MSDDVVEAEGAAAPESVEPATAPAEAVVETVDAVPAGAPAEASTERPDEGAAPAAEAVPSAASATKKPAAPRKPRTTSKSASGSTSARKSTTRKPAGTAKSAAAKPAAAAKSGASRSTATRTTAAGAEAAELDAASEPTQTVARATKSKPKSSAATAARKSPTKRKAAPAAPPKPAGPPVLVLNGLTKKFGDVVAVDDVTLSLDQGTFTGIVGPNGAGKTTTLSMVTGLLRPTSGQVLIGDIDVWKAPQAAKRLLGVLPDRLHTFDRLTGAQLLYYTAILHGLDRETATKRTRELAEAFKVEHAMTRLITDYSTGMLKKIALAAALIHAPRVLVLDEPFESVDPVSAMTVAKILKDFVAAGGTVLLSSHSMELVERICDHVAVIVEGRLIAGGTVDEVRGDQTLQERFIDLAGADTESIADLTWLHRFSA